MPHFLKQGAPETTHLQNYHTKQIASQILPLASSVKSQAQCGFYKCLRRKNPDIILNNTSRWPLVVWLDASGRGRRSTRKLVTPPTQSNKKTILITMTPL
jgi:hypothetical protein